MHVKQKGHLFELIVKMGGHTLCHMIEVAWNHGTSWWENREHDNKPYNSNGWVKWGSAISIISDRKVTLKIEGKSYCITIGIVKSYSIVI